MILPKYKPKDIPGYEGLYGVTKDGKVYSFRTKKFLKPAVDKGGYLYVCLTNNKTKKTYLSHRLVALTYIPNPNNYPQVNHKDENKQNNHISNLEWCTNKYNCNYGTKKERLSKKLKGKFISFEGVEGAGKSTQSKLLVEYLNKNGIKAVWTREPGGSEGAEEIRKVIMLGGANQWDGITELLLMSAARRDHTEKKIKPLLKEGYVVVSDRYFDSTIAYQGYGHELDLNKIKAVQNVVLDGFKPDITIILDLEVEKGLARTEVRGEKNRFEDMKLEL